ncbi:VanZ family protein [Gemmata sp. JC717]|uniref:VanZ family protein n=1 Tax=Gemmata algarum TaxID=2975278 RepID=UPI0021BB7A02|nr:VanZ family protein [Gemmata algarum]MDY3556692.1 VanZ family protein [Gemmata algarum]
MTSNRRALAWVAAGMAAFVVYGSLVPFHFGPRTDSFVRVMSAGVRIASRSDAIANVLLTVPLGFALLGAAAADRCWSRAKATAAGVLAVVPACALLAAAVECAQLYTPGRNCSASDVVAQTLGALLGVGCWVLFGQALADRARAIWDRSAVNAVGQLLLAYLGLVLLVQVLPLDLSPSPADFYRKARAAARFGLFGELKGMSDAEKWKRYGDLAKLAALYFPAGLLAARLKGRIERWSTVHVLGAALALGLCFEAAQLVVQSRTPSFSDVLVGTLAVVAGWYAGRVHDEGLAVPFALSWFVVWFAALTPITQPPPGVPPLNAPRPFDWVPGLPLESGDPLFTLGELLTKLVLFGLLGVIVAAWRLPPRWRGGPTGSVRVSAVAAGGLGLFVSALIESGQRWTDTHTPCVTDVLLGGAGAALGVLAASRLIAARAVRR